MNTVPLKYGCVAGGTVTVPLAMAASQSFVDRGGKFVDINATGYGETMDSSSTMIFGWAEVTGHHNAESSVALAAPRRFVTSTTVGLTKLPVIIPGTDSLFRMPVAYYSATYTVNFSQAMVGKEVDIYLDGTSFVQFADLTNSTDDFIVILDGLAASTTYDFASTTDAFGDGWVLVRANPDTMGGL
jgi:hypothetical protein